MTESLAWVKREDDEYVLDVDATLYDVGAIMRACYRFTDRFYLFITRETERILRVRIASKDGNEAMETAGQFSNALIDEQLRVALAAETRTVRELIYRQAFVEADFQS